MAHMMDVITYHDMFITFKFHVMGTWKREYVIVVQKFTLIKRIQHGNFFILHDLPWLWLQSSWSMFTGKIAQGHTHRWLVHFCQSWKQNQRGMIEGANQNHWGALSWWLSAMIDCLRDGSSWNNLNQIALVRLNKLRCGLTNHSHCSSWSYSGQATWEQNVAPGCKCCHSQVLRCCSLRACAATVLSPANRRTLPRLVPPASLQSSPRPAVHTSTSKQNAD
jgi:hypothetical protein